MKIAVFLPNWIGDVVMATPALRALRNHFRDAHIIGVFKPYVADVLQGTAWLDEGIAADKNGAWSQRWPYVTWKLRNHKADLAILFPNTLRTAWMAWSSGCRQRIGFRRYGRGPLLTKRLEAPRSAKGKYKPYPALDAYNDVAMAAGCPDPGHRMELATTDQDEVLADDVWEKENLGGFGEVVCLNPGAAFGAAKHWPADHFAALAQEFVDTRGCGVLVLCGPNERDQARNIATLANRPAVRSLAEHSLSIGLSKACVRRCSLLVTTDSGPRHFGVAFNRPVVGLFGPTDSAWTITYHPKEIYLQKEVPCGPCNLRVCPLDHRCMNELTPQEVFVAATGLLARQETASSQRKAV